MMLNTLYCGLWIFIGPLVVAPKIAYHFNGILTHNLSLCNLSRHSIEMQNMKMKLLCDITMATNDDKKRNIARALHNGVKLFMKLQLNFRILLI